MLAQWFTREIGQIVAPDDKFMEEKQKQQQHNNEESSFWQMIAPDPNFQAKEQTTTATSSSMPPPSSAFLSPVKQVECIHCHRMTPVVNVSVAQTPDTSQKQRQKEYNLMMTPQQALADDDEQQQQQQEEFVHKMVLQAAKDTSKSVTLPGNVMENHAKLFRICASSKPIADKIQSKMRKMIKSNPTLLYARATHLGNLVPNGYTPLMAAAYANQIAAVEILLQFDKEQQRNSTTPIHQYRDLEGKTPLHIAAEQGHLPIIDLLLPLYDIPCNDAGVNEDDNNNMTEKQSAEETAKTPQQPQTTTTTTTNRKSTNNNRKSSMKKRRNNNQTPQQQMVSPPPIDLLGRTPLGTAITSPNPKAKQHQKELEKTLFSPTDVSVYGNFIPMKDRYFYTSSSTPSSALNVMYGFSEMPGFRVNMEDTILCCPDFYLPIPSEQEKEQQNCCLVGVSDGHSDQRQISQYIADHMSDALQSTMKESDNSDNKNSDEYWKSTWEKTCLDMDMLIKQDLATNGGGATAIFALVTSTSIIVANVGDCRCILIEYHHHPPKKEEAEKEKEDATKTEQEAEGKNHDDAPSSSSSSSISVQPLSQDHKPNLEQEQQRIENAGLKVVPVTFEQEELVKEEEGTKKTTKTITIHKVSKSEKDSMAVSRSFGDFDYKDNKGLSATEQAVVPIPDITIHARDGSKSDDDDDETKKSSFLVLASDGIWDVMTNQEVAEFIRNELDDMMLPFSKKDDGENNNNGMSTITEEGDILLLPQIADSLLMECLENRGARDNLSVVIVALDATAQRIHEYQQQQQQPATASTNDDDYTSSLLLQGKALNFNSPNNAIV